MGRRRKNLPATPVPASIESLSHEGRGIAHIDGKTTFIRGALPGEDVMFQYTSRRSKLDEGYVTDVIKPSAKRIDAKCQHYGVCGGCSLQHLDELSQIEHKQDVLLQQFAHMGQVESKEILPPLTGPAWGYRHKARLGVKFVEKKGKVLIGFREHYSRFIADISRCEVLHPAIGMKLPELQSLISKLSVYNQIPQIEVAIGDNSVVLIVRHLAPLTDEDYQTLLDFEDEHNIIFYLQSGGPKTVIKLNPDRENNLYYELPDHNVKIAFNPSNFTQVNTDINRKMIDRVINMLELSEEDAVLDLFCGLGNFTLPISRYCQSITGVELSPELVAQAEENARLNNIENAAFVAMDLAQDDLEAEFLHKPFNKLLLDPARSGADVILKRLPLKETELIVYVSCNPATLARDSEILVHEKGFELLQAGVMDMFPHTSHVESIALFKKKVS